MHDHRLCNSRPSTGVKVHVWRYDETTPRAERPWIVSFEGTAEPADFETWPEAIRAASAAVKANDPDAARGHNPT